MSDLGRILIVDDDRAFRVGTGALLTDEGYEVLAVGDGIAAVTALDRDPYDLVLLDLKMEGQDGLSVLEEIRGSGKMVPVLMLTGYATVDTAVKALKLGAEDYITKPCDNDLLRAKISEILFRRSPSGGPGIDRIVAGSPKMHEVVRSIGRVAPTQSTVLLRGSTGTGKELVARAIHEESPRRDRPFVPVNCSALAEGVLESELFGHARGAFTGAVEERKGVFETAEGGTIFLDEIGDVSQAMQAKLLRVLQEREVTRVGTAMPFPIDVRVVAATHRDLEALVEAGDFRADLYFRLKVFQIRIPDLRERPEDLAALLSTALARWNKGVADQARKVSGWSDETLEALRSYDWPGNVRELMAAVEHACIVAEGGRLLPSHLPAEIRQQNGEHEMDGPDGDPGRRYQAPETPEEEREAIREALEIAGGNRTRAASMLGMGRTTLWQKLKAYGLD